jgi:hypothetical protein
VPKSSIRSVKLGELHRGEAGNGDAFAYSADVRQIRERFETRIALLSGLSNVE